MSELAAPPSAKRPFGLWTAIAMVVGAMVGAGIFVLPGQLAASGWTGVVAWVPAGLGAMTIGLVLADLVASRPEEPSVLALCGTVLGPAIGVMIAWSYWVSSAISNAVLATVASGYLAGLVPALGGSPMRIACGGVAVVVGLTVANLRGAGTAGRIQVITTVLKLLPLAAVLMVLALLFAQRGDVYQRHALSPLDWRELTPVLPLALFALLGFECVTLMTELVRDPARNIPRALVGGVGATALIYFVVCTGIVMVMPARELAASSQPVALFIERFVGTGPARALALFAAIASIGCLNGAVLLLGEIPRSLVHRGHLPGWMARSNRHGVATQPLIGASALTVVLLLASTSHFGAGVLNFLLLLTTSVSIWFYLGACIVAIVLRRRVVLAVIGIVFCAWLFYSTGLEAGGWGLVLLMAGLPIYLLGRRSRDRAAVSPGAFNRADSPATSPPAAPLPPA